MSEKFSEAQRPAGGYVYAGLLQRILRRTKTGLTVIGGFAVGTTLVALYGSSKAKEVAQSHALCELHAPVD